MRLKIPYVRTMKLVQNGTITPNSRMSCPRPGVLAIV